MVRSGAKRSVSNHARALAAAVFLLAAAPLPSDRLPDPAQDARARALFQEVRCLVCQNETIDDSDADLAADLRRAVRTQVAAGRSDEQVRDFLVARYGDYVLFKPRFDAGNAALWLLPFVLAGGGLAVLLLRRARPGQAAGDALSAEDEMALQALLAAAPPDGHGSDTQAPRKG